MSSLLSLPIIKRMPRKRIAVYLGTNCNRGLKRAFPTGVLYRWHNCLHIYWRTSCLLSEFGDCHVPATEWCQRYLPCYVFSVSNSVCFSLCWKPGSGVRRLPNIGHRTLPKMWKVRFLYGTYFPGEWFWIIMVKIKTTLCLKKFPHLNYL